MKHGYNGQNKGYTRPTVDNVAVRRVKHKKKKHHKVLLVVLIVLLVLVLGVGIGVALYIASLNQAMAPSEEVQQQLDETLVETDSSHPYYALLLGSDARESDTASRSDTMILVRIDADNAQATLISIPRDTKVEIKGYGTQKINAAYAYGGAGGAVRAVQDLAGVTIGHYAEIHFDELVDVIDQLGGIWVDVPVSNTQTGASNSGIVIEAGEQLMDGETALAFARERYGYYEGDFQRAENQRLVVQAIIDKVLSLPVSELPGTIQSLCGSVTTSYSVGELVELAQAFQSKTPTFYSAMVPSTTQTIDGVSYTITKEDEWEQMMALVDAGEDPNSGGFTSSIGSGDATDSATGSDSTSSAQSG